MSDESPIERRRWYTEVVLTVATVFVAGLALWQSYETSAASRQHNQLSIHPQIGFYTRESDAPIIDEARDRGTAGINIENNGVGPAIIDSMRVRVCQGENECGDWSDGYPEWAGVLSEAKAPPLGELDIRGLGFADGDAVRASDTFPLLSVQTEALDGEARARLDEALDRIDIEVDYHSIYGVRCSVAIFAPRTDCHLEGEPWPGR